MPSNVPRDLWADISGGGHVPADHLLIYEDRVEYVKPSLLGGGDRTAILMRDIRSVSVGGIALVGGGWLRVSSVADNIYIGKISRRVAERGAELIQEARAKAQRRQSLSPARSTPDQIRQLAELRTAGAITEDEFQRKKADLLSRM